MKPRTAIKRIFWPPAPLRRLDDFLLRRHPQVWRLRIHYIFLFWLLAGLTLFIAGYSMPVDFYQIKSTDDLHGSTSGLVTTSVLLIALLSFSAWRNKLSAVPPRDGRWYFTLVEILLYSVCMTVILMVIIAFSYGLHLKKMNVNDRADTIYESEFFASHNLFYPYYIPHYDTSKIALPDQYFRHGESLTKVLLQRYQTSLHLPYRKIENYGHYDSRWFGNPLEVEGLSSYNIHFHPSLIETAWDTVCLWGYMPFFKNDFQLSVPITPYILSGLTVEEGLRFLEHKKDTFTLTQADILQINKHYSDYTGTHLTTDSVFAGQSYQFAYDPFAWEGRQRKTFSYKCFIESLNFREKEIYLKYLLVLDKNDIVFEENDIYNLYLYDSLNTTYKVVDVGDKEMNTRFRPIFTHYINFKNAIDSISSQWYKEYMADYDGEKFLFSESDRYYQRSSSIEAQQYESYMRFSLDKYDSISATSYKNFLINKKLYSNRLKKFYPQNADSLLFFLSDNSGPYFEDIARKTYSRYLDFYFEKFTVPEIDSLNQYLIELGYVAPQNIRDNNGKKFLLYKAYEFAVDNEDTSKKYNAFLKRKTWIHSGFATVYLAVLFFFFTNTNVVTMMRSFVTIIISFAILVVFEQLLQSNYYDGSLSLIDYISLFFISGVPAIATIIFLIILPYQLKLLAMLSQIQIVLSFISIVFLNPARLLGLPNNHFAYNNCSLYVLAYWCILLIIIAILYRRHETLPERA